MKERLQKLIAEAGLASRRKAEEMIRDGLVRVNGVVVTELGTKADPAVDYIKVGGKMINALLEERQLVHVLLNKPRGYLSSTSDPQQRPLAIDLLPPALREKVHTVGRLDFNTEGLLILTNDGALTNHVTKAGRVPKVYQAKVKGHPSEEQIARLRRGVTIDGRRTKPAEIEQIEATGADNVWYRVVLVEGRNQQIRKMFDAIGHSVVKLRRVQIGPITDVGLKLGDWRPLTDREIAKLKTPAATSADSARLERTAAGKPGGPTRRTEVKTKPKRAGQSRAGRAAKPRAKRTRGGAHGGAHGGARGGGK
jgi:23S rRNA pseudouridine2605 synthase